MWPWEGVPASVAHGILDDETYDWRACAEAVIGSGGAALVVPEELLRRANVLARETTGIDVDATGTAGLAGLLDLLSARAVRPDDNVAVLFTGAVRRPRAHPRPSPDEVTSGGP